MVLINQSKGSEKKNRVLVAFNFHIPVRLYVNDGNFQFSVSLNPHQFTITIKTEQNKHLIPIGLDSIQEYKLKLFHII